MINQFSKSLEELGLCANDKILIHSSIVPLLFNFPNEDSQFCCNFLLESLRKVLGRNGVIAALTATWGTETSYYDRVHTKASKDLGMFAEYLRQLPTSVRSDHPIFSLCFLSENSGIAEYFTADHKYAFGAVSPWQKMIDHDFKIVTVGLHSVKHLTLIHHAEQLAGVPYCYNKVFTGETYEDTKLVSREYFYSVPYRGLNVQYSEASSIKADLLKRGLLSERNFHGIHVSVCSMNKTLAYFMRALVDSPYLFLTERPTYVPGAVPTDSLVHL